MVNISKGRAARTEVLTVRVTAAEKIWLTKGWGTAGRALRGLIEKEKRATGDYSSTPSREASDA